MNSASMPFYFMPGAGHLAAPLLRATGAERGELDIHPFPDGESYIRFLSDPAGKDIALVACLNDPDPKLVPLIFAASTARSLGARSVGLVAPYMPYFRQDVAFHKGECVSARHLGALLSDCFSWVVTLDPHLHRMTSLDDVFSIPGEVARSAKAVAGWIRDHVDNPLILGPDVESEQWVKSIANICDAPHTVFRKTRFNHQEVQIAVPPDFSCEGHTPVIVDDIASSGGTLAELLSEIRRNCTAPPICCIVHGIFSDGSAERLRQAGAGQVVTTNSIAGPGNQIDIAPALAEAIESVMRSAGI